MGIREIQEEIIRLKKEKDICILAHCYQTPEILEVADFVGDSFALSVSASKVKNKTKIWRILKMKEFKYVVTDNEGIHARPAGELVKLVKGFESTISIEKEGKKVDCRKLLALMGLGVKKGHEVTFTIEGADEEAAYEAVSKFMQENL